MCLPLTDSGPVAALPPHITSSEGGIRVLIADDHAIMLEGLTVMLSKEPDIEVVGQARDGRQAIEMTRRLTPDVVLMDIGMPGLNGIEATRIIRAEMPRVRVLGLSMLYEEGEGAEAMREAGAIAYVTKSAPSSEVLAALRSCMSGGGNEPVQRHEPYV
jgi:DNA-binding NarL/FixJ family response regulator